MKIHSYVKVLLELLTKFILDSHIQITVGLCMVLDQLTKLLIRLKLAEGETVEVIANIFHLTRYENRYFSFRFDFGIDPLSFQIPGFMIMIPFCAYLLQKAQTKMDRIFIGSFFSGLLGNLGEKIIRGSVTDFMDLNPLLEASGGRFIPVSNMADVFLTAALVYFMIRLIQIIKYIKSTSKN